MSIRPRVLRPLGAVALGALLSLAVGCASPPQELVEAQNAYKETASGPASEFAPAQLRDAQKALQRAERAYDEGDETSTMAFAYIAQRKTQIADVEADIFQARRQQEQNKEALLTESEQARRSLQGALSASNQELRDRAQKLELERQQLQTVQDELEAARKAGDLSEAELREQEQKLQAQQQALAQREQELAVTRTQLEQTQKEKEEAEKRLAAARAKLDEFAKVQEDQDRIVITLTGEVLFQLDKSELRAPAKARLDQVAEVLLAKRDQGITIEGHTDSQGSASHNEKLSQERAESVRSYLVNQGIAPDRVKAVGKGQTDPVASNDTPEGRANNRRVEIIVEKGKSPGASLR